MFLFPQQRKKDVEGGSKEDVSAVLLLQQFVSRAVLFQRPEAPSFTFGTLGYQFLYKVFVLGTLDVMSVSMCFS